MPKNLVFTLSLFFLLIPAVPVSAQSIAPNVQRILFLGNSITYAGNYVNNVAAYIIAQNPARPLEFINVGLPSETVSGLSEEGHAGGSFPRPDLHERLGRVLEKTKPDLVFACYGMNDGIYLPLDQGRFTKFKEGVTWLHEQVVKSGARIIHVTPPDYDELKGKQTGYAAVLDKYATCLKPTYFKISRAIIQWPTSPGCTPSGAKAKPSILNWASIWRWACKYFCMG